MGRHGLGRREWNKGGGHPRRRNHHTDLVHPLIPLSRRSDCETARYCLQSCRSDLEFLMAATFIAHSGNVRPLPQPPMPATYRLRRR
jgi:hypothetical protein